MRLFALILIELLSLSSHNTHAGSGGFALGYPEQPCMTVLAMLASSKVNTRGRHVEIAKALLGSAESKRKLVDAAKQKLENEFLVELPTSEGFNFVAIQEAYDALVSQKEVIQAAFATNLTKDNVVNALAAATSHRPDLLEGFEQMLDFYTIVKSTRNASLMNPFDETYRGYSELSYVSIFGDASDIFFLIKLHTAPVLIQHGDLQLRLDPLIFSFLVEDNSINSPTSLDGVLGVDIVFKEFFDFRMQIERSISSILTKEMKWRNKAGLSYFNPDQILSISSRLAKEIRENIELRRYLCRKLSSYTYKKLPKSERWGFTFYTQAFEDILRLAAISEEEIKLAVTEYRDSTISTYLK